MTSDLPFSTKIGHAFVHLYYSLLHKEPKELAEHYLKDSLFSHNDEKAIGRENIEIALQNLEGQYRLFDIFSVDVQEVLETQDLLVVVVGAVTDTQSRSFVHCLSLKAKNDRFYVKNDLFRIIESEQIKTEGQQEYEFNEYEETDDETEEEVKEEEELIEETVEVVTAVTETQPEPELIPEIEEQHPKEEQEEVGEEETPLESPEFVEPVFTEAEEAPEPEPVVEEVKLAKEEKKEEPKKKFTSWASAVRGNEPAPAPAPVAVPQPQPAVEKVAAPVEPTPVSAPETKSAATVTPKPHTSKAFICIERVPPKVSMSTLHAFVSVFGNVVEQFHDEHKFKVYFGFESPDVAATVVSESPIPMDEHSLPVSSVKAVPKHLKPISLSAYKDDHFAFKSQRPTRSTNPRPSNHPNGPLPQREHRGRGRGRGRGMRGGRGRGAAHAPASKQ